MSEQQARARTFWLMALDATDRQARMDFARLAQAWAVRR